VKMGLIERSEAFLARSLEDADAWGWSIILTNPEFSTQEVTGQARNISMLIDIESGTEVQQEQASVTVRLSSVTIGEPEKNWKVTVKDTAGNSRNFYVVEAYPDRTLGVVVLKLGSLL